MPLLLFNFTPSCHDLSLQTVQVALCERGLVESRPYLESVFFRTIQAGQHQERSTPTLYSNQPLSYRQTNARRDHVSRMTSQETPSLPIANSFVQYVEYTALCERAKSKQANLPFLVKVLVECWSKNHWEEGTFHRSFLTRIWTNQQILAHRMTSLAQITGMSRQQCAARSN